MQDARGSFNQSDLRPKFAGHCRGFEADIPATDDQKLTAATADRSQAIGVVEGTHVVHASKTAANLVRQPPRAGARREDQMIIGESAAVRERHASMIARHREDARRQAELDAIVGVELLRPELQTLYGRFTKQVCLGQRRALIGRMLLVTDQDDTPGIAQLPQLGAECETGLAASDNDGGLSLSNFGGHGRHLPTDECVQIGNPGSR